MSMKSIEATLMIDCHGTAPADYKRPDSGLYGKASYSDIVVNKSDAKQQSISAVFHFKCRQCLAGLYMQVSFKETLGVVRQI